MQHSDFCARASAEQNSKPARMRMRGLIPRELYGITLEQAVVTSPLHSLTSERGSRRVTFLAPNQAPYADPGRHEIHPLPTRLSTSVASEFRSGDPGRGG